ncbi:hypothetical protein [Moraxella lacunata]
MDKCQTFGYARHMKNKRAIQMVLHCFFHKLAVLSFTVLDP